MIPATANDEPQNQRLEAFKFALAKWVSTGAGAYLMYEVFGLVRQDPAHVSIVLGWGPVFIIALAILWTGDRRLREFNLQQAEQTKQQCAQTEAFRGIRSAFERMSERDDQRAREQDILLNHLARTAETILTKLEQMETAR